MIYFDNAATTLQKPPEVIQAVADAMTHMGNSARGAHEESLTASRKIYQAREAIARFFGCPRADHVVFTANATESLNTAIYGLLHSGDHVITTDLEHNSVLRPLYRLERERGVQVSFVEADSQGNIDYGDFEKKIRPDTRAIICTHGSNVTGNLIDIARVAEIARENHLIFVVDASQTAGILPIDMEAMGIDVLCFSGHKSLFGPQGIGCLCICGDLEIAPLKVGGSGIRTYDKVHPRELPTGLEAGTLNGHGISGLLAGISFIQKTGIDAIHSYESKLTDAFYRGAVQIPGVKVYGDFSGQQRTPVVSLNLGNYDSSEVSDALEQEYRIATRPGAHCAPRMHEALGTVEQGTVRFSFSWFNTMEEVEKALRALRELARE